MDIDMDGCGRRWMWMWMDVEVARLMTHHIQVCLDLEIFGQVYTATIHY